MKRIFKSAVAAVVLLSVLLLSLAGCAMEISAECLSEGVTPRAVEYTSELSSLAPELSDFALRLFGGAVRGEENSVISPASVLIALAMAANGAEGNTLAEMESVLGADIDALNLYLKAYTEHLTSSDKAELSVANSLWLKERQDFIPNGDFLQKNADYYGADIYKAPFNWQTLRDVNNWVKKATDGMIPRVLDKIPEDAIAYLVNAIAFEAKWLSVYEKHDVREATFYNADGSRSRVDFMHSTEGRYVSNGNCKGFLKSYEGARYSFAALLPEEGVSPEELIESLRGEELYAMLSSPEYTTVQTKMPKFKTEYSAELSEILSAMGMKDAFDPDTADFSRFGRIERGGGMEGGIFISRVLHKAYIEVGEMGTKAGAVTIVEMLDGTSGGPVEKPKEVCLDRPFVYMIIDNESKIPLFIGITNSLG